MKNACILESRRSGQYCGNSSIGCGGEYLDGGCQLRWRFPRPTISLDSDLRSSVRSYGRGGSPYVQRKECGSWSRFGRPTGSVHAPPHNLLPITFPIIPHPPSTPPKSSASILGLGAGRQRPSRDDNSVHSSSRREKQKDPKYGHSNKIDHTTYATHSGWVPLATVGTPPCSFRYYVFASLALGKFVGITDHYCCFSRCWTSAMRVAGATHPLFGFRRVPKQRGLRPLREKAGLPTKQRPLPGPRTRRLRTVRGDDR